MAAGGDAIHADASGGAAPKAFRGVSGVHDAGHEKGDYRAEVGMVAPVRHLVPPVSEGSLPARWTRQGAVVPRPAEVSPQRRHRRVVGG